MKKQLKVQHEKGFHLVIVILLIVGILAALGTAAFFALQKQSGEQGQESFTASPEPNDPNAPPLKIKHIGINLGEYDSTAHRVGDIVFTKKGLEAYGNLIFFDYGAVAEANSAAERRLNPQPTFIVPLGTKIHSLVDGVVVKIEKLYSDDYSVMVSDKEDSPWVYELEHVINPTVKVGDKVSAGQVVAEASTHDSQYHPGFGLYEIGILHAGNPPQHVCIFNYLDDSIRQDTFEKLNGLYAAWESYMGDTSLYDESKHVVPGCYTLDTVEG